ncbi:mitochondrion organization and biogenesis protein [Seiridium cupressi]
MLGAYASQVHLRSFAAVSAARYPRQSLRGPVRSQSDPKDQDEQSHATADLTSSSNDVASLTYDTADALVAKVDEARNSNAILDLSPEAIDALAAGLQRTPDEPISYEIDNELEQDTNVPVRQKAELAGPSRLKRSKIMPADKTPQPSEAPAPKREAWQIQKDMLKEKFPEGWNPRKKLSPDALEGIRALHTQYPQIYTTQVLSNQFKVSPEAIRRILKSKWRPNTEEDEERQQRWFNRGKNIWSQMAELGTKPPKRWREAGVRRDPRFNKKKGPKTEYPYVPKWKEKESAQRKLGDNLL